MTSGAALTRRTALAAAAVAPVVLTGCDIDSPADPAPAATATPTPLADAVLVGSLVTAIADAEAVVIAGRDAVPDLASSWDPLIAAHAAHRALLTVAAPDAAATDLPTGAVPTGRGAVVLAVRRAEVGLQRRLEQGCLQAASGDLARVLAAMAASLAQHVAVLDGAPGARRT